MNKDDVVLITVFVRTIETSDESGSGRAMLCLQQNKAPHHKMGQFNLSAGKEWRRIDWAFRAKFDLPAGAGQAVMMLGYHPQTIEIAGLRVVNFGPDMAIDELPSTKITYVGREADAAWRAEALKRINETRQTEITVKVTDSTGKPVPDAEVTIAMSRHAFPFGTAVKAKRLAEDTADSRKYRETVEANFNAAAFENDLKWFPFNAAQSNEHRNYRLDWLTTAQEWLAEREMSIHGHFIMWGLGFKKWQIEKYEGQKEQLLRDWRQAATDRLTWTQGKVTSWDTINHPLGSATNWVDWFGLDPYVEAFALGKELAPDTIHYINEGSIIPGGGRRDNYEDIIKKLQARGVEIDGIGMMGHFSSTSLTPPSEVLTTLDRFAKLAPKIRISEFDVDTEGDEQLQADYTRDFLIAAFSHPSVVGINFWGFWERQHWKPAAALWRADWSIKPAGTAYRKLVFGDWWTNESGRTNDKGEFTCRAFNGNYTVTIKHGSESISEDVTFSKANPEVVVKLK